KMEILLEPTSNKLLVEVIVISSSDEDLSTGEEIIIMGDVSFPDANDDDNAEAQPQATSTSLQDVIGKSS
nr:hypothetical protein [Tanacetum cinerariifolium]